MFIRRHTLSWRKATPIVLVVAAFGFVLVLSMFAAGNPIAFEPESGILSAGAASSNVTGASGGAVLKFAGPTSPTPTPVAVCPDYPSFPTTSCTGWQHTGVTLSAYTGPTTISSAGTVIDSKDITDCIRVSANNVTIKRSRIRCTGGPESSTTYGLTINGGVSGFVGEDLEIMSTVAPSNCTTGDPNLITRPVMADGTEGIRFTRLYAHNMRSGFWISGSNNTVIEESYITTDCNPDPHGTGADWQHSTAIADLGGATNATIRHNVVDNGAENASSAMSLYPQYGPNDNFLITQNLFNSRAYYCAYFGYTPPGESPNTRFTVTSNVWGTKYNQECGMSAPVIYSNFNLTLFNTAYPQGWGNVWSGNTWKNGTPYNLADL